MKSSFVGLVSSLFTVGLGTLSLLSLSTSSAQAQTYYSDLTSFNAATTGITLYDFEGIASTNNLSSNPDILTVAAPGRVTFSVSGGTDYNIYAFDSVYGNGYASLNGTDSVLAGYTFGSNAATTIIDLNGSYSAFAIEMGQPEGETNNYNISLYNDNTQIGTDFVTGEVPNDYFYGVTSTSTFNKVKITPGYFAAYYCVFDNARVGSAAVVSNAVPEAGTLALALPALGIVGTVLVRRKR